MASIPHEPERRRLFESFVVSETWASLAIGVMWLAVVFTAVFGPNIVANSSDGSSTTIPSGVVVALFALLGTVSVARAAFRRQSG